MDKWTKITPGSRRRSRGSILVIVVAVLMMIALIGTAYIATARLDRYAAQDHVRLTQNEATRESYVDQVAALVQRTVAEDFDNEVTGPRTLPYLGDRLPRRLNTGATRWVPAWRYITGQLYRSIDRSLGVYEPPLLNGNSVGACDGLIKVIEDNPALANFLKTKVNTDRYWAVPTSYTLQYGPNYPVEKYQNKVRMYPAMQFWDSSAEHYFPNDSKPDIYLAADADGDGIADSVLVRLTATTEPGVTYYAAVRIIDNSSAINVNTAWSRDRVYNADGSIQKAITITMGTPPKSVDVSKEVKTFHTSNIGFRELLSNQTLAPADFHLWAINRHRFGYPRGLLGSSIEGPGVNAEQRVVASDVPRDDSRAACTDFSFDSLGETMSIQLGRRVRNPGYYYDARGGHQGTFQFQAFPETDAAALAYRFCMVQWESQDVNGELKPVMGQLERTVYEYGIGDAGSTSIDGLVNSALNFAFSSVNRFRCFPADQMGPWFQWLDCDENTTSLGFTEVGTGVARLRSLRPLLTTHNAVASRAKRRTTIYKWPSSPPDAAPYPPLLLYPGMLSGDALEDGILPSGRAPYQPGRLYRLNAPRTVTYFYIGISPAGLPSRPDPTLDFPRNPVSWDLQPCVSGKAKASINNAGFPELWRGFYQVMAERKNGAPVSDASVTPAKEYEIDGTYNSPYCGMTFDPATYAATGVQNLLRMWRSPIRDDRNADSVPLRGGVTNLFQRLKPMQVMALRSALAAVNTVALRDSDPANWSRVPSRRIVLHNVNRTFLPKQYEVTVFGYKPQPFIVEVYANNDTSQYDAYKNANGYVAIKLYNPYDSAIQLKNWVVATLDRNPSNGTRTLTKLMQFPNTAAAPSVPAGGYLLLESLPTTIGTGYRPSSTRLPLTAAVIGNSYSVKELSSTATSTVFDKELILLRPVDPDPTYAPNRPSDPKNFEYMVPVDQFDFTGLKLSATACFTWHYSRKSGSSSKWDCVYPGRYDAKPGITQRHQGTVVESYTRPGGHDKWNRKATDSGYDPAFPEGSGVYPTKMKLKDLLSTDSMDNTYPKAFSIQLFSKGMPGPFTNPSRGVYPYGGFARNGDIMQVPFIGAYCIRDLDNGNKIVEMNGISMDSAFAEDTNTLDDSDEQIGRFCPLQSLNANYCDAYNWAARLFEYLDVQVPAEEFLPNRNWYAWTGLMEAVPSSENADLDNSYRGANDLVPVQGRVNANTAPRKVLEMVPWVADSTNGYTDVARSKVVADAIASYRETDRTETLPAGGTVTVRNEYASLFDLNRIVDASNNRTFQLGNGAITAGNVASREQDNCVLTPDNGTMTNDFKTKYVMMNRISNLVTTRSDTFTCYILVQGWREAGTGFPCLDWEQRKAFILDRSGGPEHLKIIPVPTD
ncbi:MAG: hypothetical protein NTU53_15720 [Planctomycetota bacterium]|nr:hypothetical protein [Planctomycetota bacterium]